VPRKIPPKFLPILLSAPLVLMGLISLYCALRQPAWINRLFIELPDLEKPFGDGGLFTLALILRISGFVLGAIMLAAGVIGLMQRRPAAATKLRGGYVAVYILTTFYAIVALVTIGAIHDNRIKINEDVPGVEELFYIKFAYLWPAVLAGIVAWILYTLSRSRDTRAVYGDLPVIAAPREGEGNVGVLDYRKPLPRLDDDPALKRTFNISLAFHVLIIVILPLMFRGFGCALEYKIPGGGGGGGGGGAVEQVIKVERVIKKEKRKKVIINPNSAIIIYIPDIDDSKVRDEVAVATEQTYQAKGMTGKGKGKLGGPGEGDGGWGDGDPNAVLTFIRLQHDGAGWDDGMSTGHRADANFLEYVGRASGMRVAPNGTAIPIHELKRYKKGQAPPFVYITGNGGIRGLTSTDEKTLRQYVLDGGMIFADAGSAEFGQTFRALMSRVFPDKPFVDISNDDEIFGTAFMFANGAPPLWHHDGTRARGVKLESRWGVFYFPGDMNDAWKTGNSGVKASVAEQAFQMGTNVLQYAFVKYVGMAKKS